MRSIAIVLNGTSSAGKTSIAKALQRLSPIPALHASVDTFLGMLYWPTIGADEERKECIHICAANFHATLATFAANPFLLVVDHVFEQHAWFEECQKALRQKKTYFVGVHCPLAILEKRERQRGDRRIGIAKGQFDIVHLQKPYALELDTSLTSPEECASKIIQFIANEISG